MGNSNNAPNTDTLSLASSAPLWSRIMRDVSKDLPIEGWHRPSGLVEASVDAFSGMKPGPFSTKTVTELFIKGTAPKDTDDFHHAVTIDTASGLLWQDGCVGPKKTVGALDFSGAEAIDKWSYYDRGWQKRAAKGSGVRGGPESTRTAFFYGSGFYPYGRSWGGIFAPTDLCPIPAPPPLICGIPFFPDCPTDSPPPGGPPTPKPGKTPKP
jgi:hypothetical protein